MSDEKPAEKPEPEAADGEQKEDKDKAADEIPQKETKTEEPNAKNGAEKAVVVQTSANEEKSIAKRNATATKDLPERSGKRLRKSAKAYVPTDFTVEKQRVTIINGRGTRLSAIPSVKKSIESCPASSADLSLAHKLVFAPRGKVAPRDMKHHLLKFNGFLTPIEEDEDEDAREKLDEEAEVSYKNRHGKSIASSSSHTLSTGRPRCQQGPSNSRFRKSRGCVISSPLIVRRGVARWTKRVSLISCLISLVSHKKR